MLKTKKVVHRFSPRVVQIAAAQDRIATLIVQKAVVKDVLKGLSYEAIAEKRQISPEVARTMSKVAIARWAGELGHTATEAREIDVKRMDALLERLHELVFPSPYIDNNTGNTVQPAPDLAASRLYLDILKQRATLLGTEAAHKLEEIKTEILRREYIGIPTNKKGVIGL